MRPIDYRDYFWQDEKVRLTAMKEDDGTFYYYNRFDTPARRLLNCEVEPPPTESESRAFVEKFIDFKPGTGRLMLSIENHGGQTVGAVNLNSVDEHHGTFSVGMLIDRDHRGKGYGTAAMRILLRYAFFERRLNKYYGHVLEGNVPSATMLRKLGCKEEGVRRQMIYTNGRYHDEIHFGLTREEFEAQNVCD